jgi:hypothetical protein
MSADSPESPEMDPEAAMREMMGFSSFNTSGRKGKGKNEGKVCSYTCPNIRDCLASPIWIGFCKSKLAG